MQPFFPKRLLDAPPHHTDPIVNELNDLIVRLITKYTF